MRNYWRKNEAISTKIEDLKNIKLMAIPLYNHRYVKRKRLHTAIKLIVTYVVQMCNAMM